MVGHYAWYLGILGNLQRQQDKLEKVILFFLNSQEKRSLMKAVANGSIE